MPLPKDFENALVQLADACKIYHQLTGSLAVLVGGAATAIYTAGRFMSGDFDIVAADGAKFDEAMARAGFVKEHRKGHLLIGYFHPDHPGSGFQQVSGSLFDGASDPDRIMLVSVTPDGSEIAMPSFEDMIADRLAQAAVASPTDPSRLLQARALDSHRASTWTTSGAASVRKAATLPLSKRKSVVVRVKLDALLEEIEARKAAIGMRDTPETIDALRNKGASRTPEKRELLRRIEDRARAAGREPLVAYY